MKFTAETIAGFLGGEVVGNKDAAVWTMAKIEEGEPGAIAFLSNPKYEPYLYTTRASIVIVNRSLEPKGEVGATMVKVDDAYACFARLLELYAASKPQKSGISPQAAVAASATLGEGAYVGEFAVVGEGVTAGEGCRIYPQVWVGDNVRMGDRVTLFPGAKIYDDTVIGNDVVIHAGAVIGADGFGFAPNAEGSFDKIPQIGNVMIGDRVEIGANTCVDRATMGSTVIKSGAKLDNLIQIGHNVSIGENTVFAAQVGVAGSTRVGDNCMFGGQVGVAGHLTIGDRVQMGSQSGVSNSLPGGHTYMGSPAMSVSKHHRVNAVIRSLPDLSADVHKLKKEMASLLDAQR